MMTAMTNPAAWLAQWASWTPEKVALVLPDNTRWSYRRLSIEVDRWSAEMRGRGVGPGDVVAATTADPVAARLLRLAAGRVGSLDALIDPTLPAAASTARTAAVRPVVILADSGFLAADPPPAAVRPAPATAGWPATSGRVLFTTGTTGEPHAVMLSAAALRSAALSNVAGRGLRRSDVLLSLLPPWHAAGSLFEDSILAVGGTLRLPSRDGGDWLCRALATGPATVSSMVPSMLSSLANRPEGLASLNRLRLLNYAGEPIGMDLLRRLMASFRGLVTRGYGLTEAGPLVSILTDTEHRKGPLPGPTEVGRPAPGVQVRVDSRTGELQVRSAHLMTGYLHDPAATARRLHDGWLATGDLAEFDGHRLRLTGRIGERIRSGAEWVGVPEVRSCLGGVRGVSAVAVLGVPHPRWVECPVAFIEVTNEFDGRALFEAVRTELAQPARPAWIAVLPELPRTANGKLDLAALRVLAADGRPAGAITGI